MAPSGTNASPLFVRGAVRAVVCLTMLVCVLVLVGWALDVEVLKRMGPGMVSMNPITAVTFVLAAVSLWLQQDPSTPAGRFLLAAKAAALLVFIIGSVRVASLWLPELMDIDKLIFTEKLRLDADGLPNRMAPNTAGCFVLLGLALLVLDTRPFWLTQGCIFAVALISLVAVMGYTYQVRWLYGIGNLMPMALHTALLLQLLALALLFARPQRGIAAIIVSSTPAGTMARSLLPGMVVILWTLGWLRLEGERRGLYEPELGVALFTTANVALFGLLIWRTIGSIQRADTAIIRLNADLAERAGQLEEANQELESFSYSVSHDLRAPLRHVQGYVQMLSQSLKGQLAGKPLHYLETINAASMEMGALIDDLLMFSRMGRAEFHQQGGVDLNPIIEDLISKADAGGGGRRIDWRISPLPTVAGDAAMLKQVFANLISNAVKYTRHRPDAWVEISALGKEGHRWIVCVRDNGAGFDMRYAQKLFGVFQRLHRPDEFEGTGIGLAIVRRIVSRHGGRVWAEGEVDKGAAFFLTLESSSHPPGKP